MLHEVEITDISPLEPADRDLLDLHSILNIGNVLSGELQLLSLDLEVDLTPALDRCTTLLESLYSQARTLAIIEDIPLFEQEIFATIQQALAQNPEAATQASIQESIANLNSVFAILEVRVRELIHRWQYPDQWLCYSIQHLTNNFHNFFTAVEKNSKGRYHIIYNLAAQAGTDYFVSLSINSPDNTTITIPPSFQDVMRDLIANSRKYTPLGGHIVVGLLDDGQNLTLAIEDNGHGIPIAELAQVTNFGVRGSNVQHLRTMGGGLGLTKAFVVTKRYGGRMWIASDGEHRTRVRLVIPYSPSRSVQRVTD